MTVRPESLSIFVPAHNEAGNLEGAVEDVVAAAEERHLDYEILVVDDGSSDGTGEVADRLRLANSRIRVVHNPTRQGLAAGYSAALRMATKDYFTFVPGDREVNVQSIRRIFRAIGSADLVVPYHANLRVRPVHRRFFTWGSRTLTNVLLGRRLRYYQGPTVYPTRLARELRTTTRGFFFVTEMLAQALDRGCTYVEVGLVHQARAFGRSKAVNLSNILGALKAILGLWWRLRVRPRRGSTTPGGRGEHRTDDTALDVSVKL